MSNNDQNNEYTLDENILNENKSNEDNKDNKTSSKEGNSFKNNLMTVILVLLIFNSSLFLGWFFNEKIFNVVETVASDLKDINLPEFELKDGKLKSDLYKENVILADESLFLYINTSEELGTKDFSNKKNNIIIDQDEIIISLKEVEEVMYLKFENVNVDTNKEEFNKYLENEEFNNFKMGMWFFLTIGVLFIQILSSFITAAVSLISTKTLKIKASYKELLLISLLSSSFTIGIAYFSSVMYIIVLSVLSNFIFYYYLYRSMNNK